MGVVVEDFREGVLTLTLNRPDKKNAMSLELLEALFHSLTKAGKEGASIVVIRGAGNTFCAGGDVIEFRDSPTPAVQVDAMADLPEPEHPPHPQHPGHSHSGGRGPCRRRGPEPGACLRPDPCGVEGGPEYGIQADRPDARRRRAAFSCPAL